MKHYRTLIKLKKREVDALRKQLGRLAENKAMLEQLMENLEQELHEEVDTAGRIVDMGVFFGDYSESIKIKQEKVDEQIKSVDAQMDTISAKMMVVFGDQKKFELALAAKEAELKAKKDKQEQDYLDELAATRHTS